MNRLTEEQLYECYKNIKDYEDCGKMGETLIRQIRKELADEIGLDNWDSSCTQAVIPAILMEIANRKYQNLEERES